MKKINRSLIPIYLITLTIAILWGAIFMHLWYPKDKPFVLSIASNNSQSNIISSHALSPTLSNQWYSSLFSTFPSNPIYVLPLSLKAGTNGLGFSYPHVQATKNTVSAPYIEDFSVGYTNDFTKTNVTGIGDWTVNLNLVTSDGEMLPLTFGHGIPSVVFFPTKDIQITFPDDFVASNNNQPVTGNLTTDALMLTIHANNYIIAFPQPQQITIRHNQILISHPTRLYVGLLDQKDHYSLFKQNSNVTILDSQSFPQLTNNNITIQYKITTDHDQPLIALYPHQYDSLIAKQDALGSYQTLRGPLRLIKADNFSITLPQVIPNGSFTKLIKDYPDLITQIKQDIHFVMTQKPASNDYYLGTWFGEVSTLLLLADTYHLDKEKQELLRYVEPIFAESLTHFHYSKQKTSVIADNPEFGNENLNDHHFHYGYYIRTAAVLANFDLPFLSSIKQPIDDMVQDIATNDRSSQQYPYLRNFDIYEGHSWADGAGATADGNNQESSSEAINAWYSCYLWGKIMNDSDLQKTSLFLYNSEIQSASYYWFNTKNIYPSSYNHAIASIVWGGKVDFATWFSAEPNMIYGIQILPLTPASLYLGTMPTFTKYEKDFHTSGGSEKDPWGNLFATFKSFYAPQDVVKIQDSITKFEAHTPKSLFLYLLYYNLENNQNTPTPSLIP